MGDGAVTKPNQPESRSKASSKEAVQDVSSQNGNPPPNLPNNPAVRDTPFWNLWKHNKKFKQFRRDFIYFFAYLPVTTAISLLPLAVARSLGGFFGLVGYYFSKKQRKCALKNLKSAFPEKSASERKRIAKASFKNASIVFTESLVISRWSRDQIESRFQLEESLKPMDVICENGAVGITAHYGNWELLGGFFAMYRPGKLAAGAAKHSNPKIQASLERKRHDWNMEVIYSDDSPKAFLKALKNKKLLGLLPDQNLRSPNGTFVDFFNRPTYTTTLPAHLARTSKKPLFVCLLRREGKGFKWLVFPPIEIDWKGDKQQDLHFATEAYSKVLEDEFRKYPEQWVWFHDRWRTQPGDEQKYSHVRWTRKSSS